MANKFFNVHNGLVVGPATIDATSGNIVTTSTTNSNSTQSGALQVVGGAGIGGNLNIGGSFTLTGTASINSLNSATSTQSGALVVGGGVGIGGNLYVGGEIVAQKLTIQLTTVTTTLIETDDIIRTINTTQSTSTSTGALQVSGGAGIGGNLYVGGTIFGTINATVNTATNANNIATVGQTSSATYYPTFVDSNNATSAYELLHTTSSFAINPSTGNIGLGTNAPDRRLHISGTDYNSSAFRITRSGNSYDIALGTDGRLAFTSTLTEAMAVSQSGNVGIGTASPSFRLQVETNLDASAGAFIRNTNTGTGAFGVVIVASPVGNLEMRAHSAAHSAWPNSTLISSAANFTGGLHISQLGANPIRFWTNGSERTRIDSAGNVGIGTTSPSYKLDVAGSISMHDEAQDLDSRYYAGTYLRGWSQFAQGSESNITYTTTSTSPVGTEVLSVSSAVWARGPRIRLDRTQNYEVEMWIRKTAGASSGTYYMVVSNWDANGNIIGGDGTDWHYPVNSVQTNLTTGTWVRHSFIVGPYGGTKNHNSTATQIGVGFIANLGGGTDTLELTGFKCRPISNYNNNPITFNNNGNISIGSTATATAKMDVTGGVRISGITTVTNTTQATSTSTGALQVVGGVGIGGDLRVGGVIYGTINATVNTATNANNIATIAQSANAVYYPAFVDSNNATSAYELLYTTSSFAINPSTGNVSINTTTNSQKLTIGAGSILLDNTYGLLLKDNAGTAETSISITSANNLNIASPTAGGSIQISNRNSAGTIQFFAGTSTGYIQFNAGNSERMRVNNNGFVGIGTASPASLLHVNNGIFTVDRDDTSLTPGQITVRSVTSSSSRLYIGYNTASNYGSIQAITEGVAWRNLTLNPGGGNVGIGIVTATSLLHVAGTALITGVTTVSNTAAASSTISGALQVVGGVGIGGNLHVGGSIVGTVTTATNLAGGVAGSIPYQSAAGTTLFIPIGANGTLLQSNGTTATWVSTGSLVASIANSATMVATVAQTANAVYYPAFVDSNNATSAYELLYTTSSFAINPQSGFVGIGTSSPTGRMHVSGTGFIYNNANADPAGGVTIPNTPGTFFTYNRSAGLVDSEIIYGNTVNSFFRITSQSTAGVLTERMRIDVNGNVGIGTTNPGNQLTVSTATAYRGITVTGNAAPSIIFDSTNSTIDWKIGNSGSDANKFAISTGSATAGELFVIDSTGNVGIGLTSPTSKLHINGDARISGVTTVSNTTVASSTVTGALIVSGGIGVGNNVYIAGSLFATTKSFLIDHPTKPGKKLRYGSLEGPENGVYVRGRVQGTVIELPEYWTKLVDPNSITVNLTPIGRSKMPRINRIENNRIYLNKPWFGQIDCYYIVFAERNDIDKLEPEM